MEIGIAMIVAMAVMMGAKFFGGHKMHSKYKEHSKPGVEVSTSTATVPPVGGPGSPQHGTH